MIHHVAQSCSLSVSLRIVSFRDDFQRALDWRGVRMEFSVKLPRLLATLPRCEQWPRKRGTSCHFSQFGCGFAALGWYRRFAIGRASVIRKSTNSRKIHPITPAELRHSPNDNTRRFRNGSFYGTAIFHLPEESVAQIVVSSCKPADEDCSYEEYAASCPPGSMRSH